WRLMTNMVCGFSFLMSRASSRASSRTSIRSKFVASTFWTMTSGTAIGRLGSRSSLEPPATGDNNNSVVNTHPIDSPGSEQSIRGCGRRALYDDRLGFTRGIEERRGDHGRLHAVAHGFHRHLELKCGALTEVRRIDCREGDQLFQHRRPRCRRGAAHLTAM